MESLARIVALMVLVFIGLFAIIGLCIGYLVASGLELTKSWSMAVGGLVMTGVGFLVVPLIGKLNNKP